MRKRHFFGHGRTSGRKRRAMRPGGPQAGFSGSMRELPVVEGAESAEILELFGSVGHPLRLDDALRFLDLPRRQKGALRALLDALTAQGRLLRLSGGRWADASQAPTITGVLSIQRSGAGLVTPLAPNAPSSTSARETDEGEAQRPDRRKDGQADEHLRRGPDIFIHPLALGDAWHGDTVEVLVQPAGKTRSSRPARHGKRADRSRGREAAGSGRSLHPEGRILRVIRRGTQELAAHVAARPDAAGRVLCRPADQRFAFLVLADVSALPAAPKIGDLLLVLPEDMPHATANADRNVSRNAPGSAPESGPEPNPNREAPAPAGEKDEPRRMWGQPVRPGTARATLGREDDVAVQERLVKLNHLIPLDFPANVLAEASAVAGRQAGNDPVPTACDPAEIPFRSTAERQDLRSLPFVTIDGADARDFDDAICVLRRNTGWELWVAIADVSHFVRPGSALDREARERGNSCYFPASVSPMLPEILSNDLCSLRPGEDRLVMTVRLRFDASGAPGGAAFFPACIRSRARLTYEETQAALDAADAAACAAGSSAGNGKEGSGPDQQTDRQADRQDAGSDLLRRFPGLGHARDLARVLRARRDAAGALDFEVPEPEFVVDRASGRLADIRRRERLESHRLIEACMLAANEAVARRLMERGAPFPYRVHPAPDRERLENLFRTLHASGLVPPDVSTRASRAPHDVARALRRILNEARGGSGEFLVNRLTLRSMMQARYSPEAEGHFGLASTAYCHFTSPIRRYADLMTHRALRFTLDGSGPIPAGRKLLAVCDQCNARERAATEAEREIGRRLGCLLLRDRVGEGFDGIVSGLSPFGIFVELDAAPVEGMIRVESLDDLFDYDPERQELIGLRRGRRFHLGQRVRTRLADVHVGRLEITLTLVPTRKR